jgi:uncharacterized protein (DUF849 family)
VGWWTSPFDVQFVLGVLGANAAMLEQPISMRRTAAALFGEERFTCSAASVGYPGQLHLAAAALMLGGHLRVGFEDNLRVTASDPARSNPELVKKAIRLAGDISTSLAAAACERRVREEPRGT